MAHKSREHNGSDQQETREVGPLPENRQITKDAGSGLMESEERERSDEHTYEHGGGKKREDSRKKRRAMVR